MTLISNCFQRRWIRYRFGGVVLAVGLAMAGLAGCAGGADRPSPAGTQAQASVETQAQVQAAEYQRIIAELRRAAECVNTIEAKPEFAPLREKAPEGGSKDPYPVTFLDKSKATSSEQGLIASLLDQIAPCEPNFGTLTVRVHQSITRMIGDVWHQQGELYRHLKEGVITWGLFNQGTKSIADKLTGGLQALRLSNEG